MKYALVGTLALAACHAPAPEPTRSTTARPVITPAPAAPADAPTPAARATAPTTAPASASDERVPTWIGVLFEPETTRVRETLPDSPAARARLRAGDEVLSIGGATVKGPAEVIAAVQSHRQGDEVDVVIVRAGAQVHVPVTIATRPDLLQLQHDKLVGQPAPTFALPRLARGGTFDLAATRGKVVIVDFWASWCGPCRASFPALVRWHQQLESKGLVIVGVTDDEPLAVQAAVTEYHLPYSIAFDDAHDAWRAYLVQGLPTTVVIDRAGVVRYLTVGAGDDAQIEAVVMRLLK